MNWNTFIFASYEMLLTILFGLFTVFITKKILSKTFLKEEERESEPYENLAISIFSGTLILCMVLLVNTSISPAVDILNVIVMTGKPITFSAFFTSLGSALIFFTITVILSTILLFATAKAYMLATRQVDEMKEIQNKNVAVSILMSIVLLGISLSVKPPLQRFIFSLINYDKHQTMETTGDGEPAEMIPQESQEGQVVVPEKKISPKNAR